MSEKKKNSFQGIFCSTKKPEDTGFCHCVHCPCVPRTEHWALQGKTKTIETQPLCAEVMNLSGPWWPGGSLRIKEISTMFKSFQHSFASFFKNHTNGVSIFNSFWTVTGKFSVMIGNLLYVFGSCECHYKPTKKKCTSLWHWYQMETLFVVVCVNWATNRNWPTKLFGTRKVAQLNSLRQESTNN